MKSAKYIFVPFVIFVLLMLFSCKKDDLQIYKLEINSETVVKGSTSVIITADYTYPVKLKSVDSYASTSSDMTIASKFTGTVTDNVFIVTFDNLQANTTYYYQYEYSNGVDLIKTEVESFTTNDYGLPTVTTSGVSDITATSATCGGSVTDDGGLAVTARGVCWSTSHTPTINDAHTTDGSGTGNYTSYMTDMSSNTTYYVRAYATNSIGTRYGKQKTFTTTYGLPTVTTNDITNITATSATCGGSVTDDGGSTVTARGVCWSTSHTPTINDAHTTDGSGAGNYTSYMTDMSSNTTYYVRAYATNSIGTSYGDEIAFRTVLYHDWVDLGLPSGVLWATCNVGTTTPEGYGYHFAWGETEPKSAYTWNTYQYCNGSDRSITKYCNDPNYGNNGYTDNLIILQAEDDAATVNWGDNWRIPTHEEWEELYDNTSREWAVLNDVGGMLYIAPNGNTLFLPAAGWYDSQYHNLPNRDVYYWSSSLGNDNRPDAAYSIGYYTSNTDIGINYRYRGFAVRPVRDATE